MIFKDLKFTPLTIVIAICITYVFYLILGIGDAAKTMSPGIKILNTSLLALILFFSDMLFRKFIEDKKWLWLIEGSFILLITLMIIIFKTI